MQRGLHQSYYGLDGWMLSTITCGMTPASSVLDVLQQVNNRIINTLCIHKTMSILFFEWLCFLPVFSRRSTARHRSVLSQIVRQHNCQMQSCSWSVKRLQARLTRFKNRTVRRPIHNKQLISSEQGTSWPVDSFFRCSSPKSSIR